MIKIKANVSFSGAVSMRQNEERDCEKTDAIKDLIKCGYVSVIKEEKKAKNAEPKTEAEDDTPPADEKTAGENAGGEANEAKRTD